MLLPNRHVMYWRLIHGDSYSVSRTSLETIMQPAAEEDVSDKAVACTTFQVRDPAMTARRQQVLNGSTKYKHAFECGRA
ncbi:hypothetical protein GQ600_25982 [Phytophthora cactorum]|nr:hypothetical protein GQ600_25982 [Phytophthora cactorum]